jgi:hypothetical protein
MKTIQEFLTEYKDAESLDSPEFSQFFPSGVDKADFLLLNGAAVCEVKQIENVDFPARAQKLIGKKPENFKRDVYSTINVALSKANDQIEATKKALKVSNAVGIVVLDNHVLENSSVIAAIDAANRKMIGGLASVDAVLCLDMVNTFTRLAGDSLSISQCLVRDTSASLKAAEICEKVMNEYCLMIGRPKRHVVISNARQEWLFDKDKRFIRYDADFKSEG